MAIQTTPKPGAPATKPTPGAVGTTGTANGAANPAAKPEKVKKEPIKRSPYGGERDEKGELKTKLTSIPADFNPKTQLPPSAKDFADKAVFYDWRAQVAEASAVKFKKMAVQERELGDSSTRAEKKRLLSLTEKVHDIKANLLAGGMTEEAIAQLLASVVAAAPAAAAPAV